MILLLCLALWNEPTYFTWNGYSGTGACASMQPETYCTCDYATTADGWSCANNGDPNGATVSCSQGRLQKWERVWIFWPRTGFVCVPDEFSAYEDVLSHIEF